MFIICLDMSHYSAVHVWTALETHFNMHMYPFDKEGSIPQLYV